MVLLKIGPSREKGKLQLIFSRGYIYRKFQIEYHKIYAKSDGDIFLNPPRWQVASEMVDNAKAASPSPSPGRPQK